MASAQEPKEPSFKSRLQAIIMDSYKLLQQEEQLLAEQKQSIMQTAQSSIQMIEEASARRQTELEREKLGRLLQADLQIALEEAKKYE